MDNRIFTYKIYTQDIYKTSTGVLCKLRVKINIETSDPSIYEVFVKSRAKFTNSFGLVNIETKATLTPGEEDDFELGKKIAFAKAIRRVSNILSEIAYDAYAELKKVSKRLEDEYDKYIGISFLNEGYIKYISSDKSHAEANDEFALLTVAPIMYDVLNGHKGIEEKNLEFSGTKGEVVFYKNTISGYECKVRFRKSNTLVVKNLYGNNRSLCVHDVEKKIDRVISPNGTTYYTLYFTDGSQRTIAVQPTLK